MKKEVIKRNIEKEAGMGTRCKGKREGEVETGEEKSDVAEKLYNWRQG